MFRHALAAATLSLVALTAGPASATTLEINGVAQNKSVSIEASLASATSATLETTSGSFQDTCTQSAIKGTTEGTYTGSTVGGKIATASGGGCTHGTRVVSLGSFTVVYASGTNGTVRSSGMSVEVDSTTFGATLQCSSSNTHLGTLTGTSAGQATVDINAAVNCGFFVPSAYFKATYTVTSPWGLGVVS